MIGNKKSYRVTFKNMDEVIEFCKMASKFDCDIDALCGRYMVDAKSIVGILSLGISKVIEINIHSEEASELEKFTFEVRKYEV